MKEITMKARAKINLSLHVLGKRPDGYHDIESVMQLVDFGDDITLSVVKESDIFLTTNVPDLPVDEGNIAYRAADLMRKNFNIEQGFLIHIEKRIPIAAGLAGGSTNAAVVMHLINKACDLNLSVEQLAALGIGLGADVPFCLYGKPALAEGIGEKLTPITGLKDCYIVLTNPGVGVSTAMIYKALDSEPSLAVGQTAKLLQNLRDENLSAAFGEMKNVMEKVAAEACPAILDLLTKLRQAGADHAMMSGSGATCFGIFKEKPNEEKLKDLFGNSFVALAKPIQ